MVGGRTRNLTKWKLVEEVLVANKDAVIKECKIVGRKDEIWSILSDQCNNVVSAYSLWTSVRKNYNNIQQLLNLVNNTNDNKKYAFENTPSIDVESSSHTENSEEDSSDNNQKLDKNFNHHDFDKKFFSFTISNAEFKCLGPHQEYYKRNKSFDTKKSLKRRYIVFGQRNWTHIFYSKLDKEFKRLKFFCKIVFKRNKISMNSLRYYATMNGNCKECGASVLCIIWKMKVKPNLGGAVQNIGLDPFFVYFWDNTQIYIYNKFCESEYSKISLDATGGVVNKIRKPYNEKSSHIYFYDITVRNTKARYDSQYSVSSMLSESQNAVSIYSWLAHWIRAGAVKPKEVVTDMSLALIYASILAFTKAKNLNEYLSHCFEAIFKNVRFMEDCYIRIDVAHFIKMVTTWPSLKNQHRLTKHFYLRAVGQLIQCTDVEDLENLFRAIFTVSFSDTEGYNDSGVNTICEIRQEWLKKRCATGTIETVEHYIDIDNENINYLKQTDLYENDIGPSSFDDWVKEIAQQCRDIVNKDDQVGNRGNQQCLPKFADDLLKHTKTIPLWTGLLKSFFPNSPQIGSSAAVESNFNNIKNRVFGHKSLSIRVHEFLETIILSNNGQAKLVKEGILHSSQDLIITDQLQADVASQPFKDHPDVKIDVFCSSCQLHQESKEFCINCNKPVHKNPLCSSTKDGIIYCVRCSNLEQASIENWRGLTNAKRPRTSYLEPNSELLEADFSRPRNVLPVGFLKNGHLIDLRPIKISKNVSVTLSNTCVFDSFIQILACCFCDSFAFQQLIQNMIGHSDVAELVEHLVKNDVTKKTYKMRAIILEKIFNKTSHPCGIYKLNVEAELGNLIPQLNFNACITEETVCQRCGFQQIQFKKTLELEIETAADISTNILNVVRKRYYLRSCQKCHRVRQDHISQKKIALTHLLIEPLSLHKKIFSLESSLDELPKKLIVNNDVYVLRGVIGYAGPNVGIGHFTAYCLRHNNRWEM